MNIQWFSLEEVTPPERKILLVYGPLGVDLAMNIAGQWYFKQGDDWSADNVERWYFNMPIFWAEFPLPLKTGVTRELPFTEFDPDENSEKCEEIDFKYVISKMDGFAGTCNN